MSAELAAAQYDEWIAQVREVPLRLLQVQLVAQDTIRFERFPGSKINGALWGGQPPGSAALSGLARVAESHASPDMRLLARRARAHHDRRENSAGYTERPLVLGLPFDVMVLERGTPYAFNLVLFGDAAPTWPAWIEAAREMHLEPGRLSLTHYAVWAPGCDPSTPPPLDDEAVPPTTLGQLAEAVTPAPETGPGGWHLVAQTPLVIERKGEQLRDLPTLEPLVVSALSSLGAVANARPGRENTLHLRELAAQARPLRRQWKRGPALYHQGKGRHGYTIHGLLGELLIGPLPLPLVDILSLAQFTHLGQHSAFGLGRYFVQPVEL